ncbi:conserved hypothetical protein [Tenacibaculum sp. 190524A02b]|uniref:Zinc-finger domain-containing protein n=1 Tax=Tenacibaculum vairaonense TaxID=3137860 RepID=A0ABP1FJV6_9FLAO
MSTEHVNEIQIQQYVFDLDNCDKTIITHINSCEHCKSLVNEYKYLSNDLKELTKPSLDFDIASQILEQLPEKKQSKPFISVNNSALVLLAIGVLAILIHTISNINIIESYSSYFIISIVFFITILSTIEMLQTFKRKLTF